MNSRSTGSDNRTSACDDRSASSRSDTAGRDGSDSGGSRSIAVPVVAMRFAPDGSGWAGGQDTGAVVVMVVVLFALMIMILVIMIMVLFVVMVVIMGGSRGGGRNSNDLGSGDDHRSRSGCGGGLAGSIAMPLGR